MKKGVSFAGSVISFRMLISLVVTLCLVSVMLLIYTLPTFAAVSQLQLKVIIEGLGNASSANVLFSGQPLSNQCITQVGSRILGAVPAGGMFAVNFYSSKDCSGTRLNGNNPIQYTMPPENGGIVICSSDTNTGCSFNEFTSPPYELEDAVAYVQIHGLGNALGANIVFRGAQQGACITASSIANKNSMLAVSLVGNGMFSVNFYPNTSCTGTRLTPFFRFNAAQGSNGVSIDCTSDTVCTQLLLKGAPTPTSQPEGSTA